MSDSNPPVSIKSELVFYPSRSGCKITAYIDRAADAAMRREPEHFVVMSPKYGETKKNNLQLAYFLAANGFSVLRFDFTHHFGESEGDMLNFTLPAAVDDTLASIDFLEAHQGAKEVTLLASSLSALTAFQAAGRDRRIRHLVTLVGVVDLVYTLVQVYQDDLINGYIAGKRYGVLDILGHEVNMDRFFEITIAENFHTLEGTKAAVSKAMCPVSFFPAENDAWVRIEDVEAVAACAVDAKIYLIEGAMHEVRENQDAADKTMGLLVTVCHERSVQDHAFDQTKIRTPDKRGMLMQNRQERDRLRRARPLKDREDAFWGKYLEKYRVMEKMDDYQQYLDLVGELLGRFEDGDVLLDAGCGNGLLGVWVVRELLQRQSTNFEIPPLYFGMDLTDSGLSDAVGKHAATKIALTTKPERPPGSVEMIYSRIDLDQFGSPEMPPEEIINIADGSFDRVVCSLLLSYLKSPTRVLEQLHRVIRPGGRIVVSSMKPFCDLSSIYRDFVDQKISDHDVESARELLRAAGAIKMKQEQGYYTFFSGDELTAFLIRAGFKQPQCFTSLGNQACVAVATK